MSSKDSTIKNMYQNGWSLFEEWYDPDKSFLVRKENDGIQVVVVCKNGSRRKPTKREMEQVGDGILEKSICK